MTAIALIYLSPWPIGGSTSYTLHLYHALIAAGANVNIYKLGNNTEARERQLGNFGVYYRNLNFADMCKVIRKTPSLMTAAAPYKKLAREDAIEKFIKLGMKCVVHDPNEFKVYDHANSVEDPILIRLTMKKYYKKGTFIPHPYQRRYDSENLNVKTKIAASLSRVTFCKNSDIILRANRLLPKNLKVQMLGGVNRMYANFTLSKHFKEKEIPKHKGLDRVMHSQPEAMKEYLFNVDLTDFSHMNDGGGTQYSFMEAMDAGAINIIHSNWAMQKGAMENEVNCLTVSDHKGLEFIIRAYDQDQEFRNLCFKIARNAREMLDKKHDPKKIGRRYIKILTA